MATDTSKKRVGIMPCEGSRCKSHEQNIPVVVFENGKGTLSYTCDYCGRAHYARKGTDQHADWMQDIKPFMSAAPAPAAPEPAAPAPAPAKRRGFAFEGL